MQKLFIPSFLAKGTPALIYESAPRRPSHARGRKCIFQKSQNPASFRGQIRNPPPILPCCKVLAAYSVIFCCRRREKTRNSAGTFLHDSVLRMAGRAGERGRGIFRVGAKLRPCEKCRTAGRRVKSPSHLRSLTDHTRTLARSRDA